MNARDRFLPSRPSAGLVVVDVQEKLIGHLSDPERFLIHLRFLIGTARLLELPILVTEQYPRGLGPTEPSIRALLDTCESTRGPIEKMTFSCCGEAAFDEALESAMVDAPIVCGIEAHVCVAQTVLDLLGRGRRVHVVADAVDSRHAHDREAANRLLGQAGATVTTAELVGFGLFQRAGGATFKEFQRLVVAKDEAIRALA